MTFLAGLIFGLMLASLKRRPPSGGYQPRQSGPIGSPPNCGSAVWK